LPEGKQLRQDLFQVKRLGDAERLLESYLARHLAVAA
jgi:hypothetical protein